MVETSRLAKQNGIKTLYKTALYINSEPLRELLECIDIFSISLKSMSESFYRKITKGRIEPVLDAIKAIKASNKHMEISQLLVTGMNDTIEDVQQTVHWIIDNLGTAVPLHFVRFHPAYRYQKVDRTDPQFLIKAKSIAKDQGIEYCYIGNLFADDVSNTYCSKCQALLVKRLGLTVNLESIDVSANCTSCNKPSSIVLEPFYRKKKDNPVQSVDEQAQFFEWADDISNLHIILPKNQQSKTPITVCRQPSGSVSIYELGEGLSRIIVSRQDMQDKRICIHYPVDRQVSILPVLDRAHYPVNLYHPLTD